MTLSLTNCRHTDGAEATHTLGRALGKQAQPGDFIACNGPLGAGKTTFVQGLSEGLGVGPEYYVRSPTFTLMQEYLGRLPLYHFDFYRLSHEDEVWDIGFEEYLDSGGVTVVEWADKFPDILPAARLDIRIVITAVDERQFELTATDSSHAHYLKATE